MFFLSYSLSFCCFFFFFFFFNHTPTTEIYTLSLTTLFRSHRSFEWGNLASLFVLDTRQYRDKYACGGDFGDVRSEEHTSELQSQSNLVCRLLLEKKKKTKKKIKKENNTTTL